MMSCESVTVAPVEVLAIPEKREDVPTSGDQDVELTKESHYGRGLSALVIAPERRRSRNRTHMSSIRILHRDRECVGSTKVISTSPPTSRFRTHSVELRAATISTGTRDEAAMSSSPATPLPGSIVESVEFGIVSFPTPYRKTASVFPSNPDSEYYRMMCQSIFRREKDEGRTVKESCWTVARIQYAPDAPVVNRTEYR